MKKYRNEWKYSCTDGELARIEAKLAALLNKDQHAGEKGIYGVHSLYFDDDVNSCASETSAGDAVRFKYRIRYYDHNPSFLRLERKEKLNGGCYKATCRISLEEYQALVRGEVTDFLHEKERPLLQRFSLDIMTKRFSPRVIVDYERVAYVEPITNVRITMDYNIAVSHETDRFLFGDYLKIPLLVKNEHVLEVKFDEILPGYIKQGLYESHLQQRSFSKYNLGFEKIRSLIL